MSPGRQRIAVGSEHLLAVDHQHADVPPQFIVLEFTVPDGATRSQVWRRLKNVHALNLEHRRWAVARDDKRLDLVTQLATAVQTSGGTATVDVIDGEHASFVPLVAQLHRACERMWDDFFTACDRYEAHGAPSWPDAERLAELDGLHAQFASLLTRDLVRSRALDRAEHLLARFTAQLIQAGADPHAWCLERPTGRHSIGEAEVWPLIDGTSAMCCSLSPAVGPLWDAAFNAFEARTYRRSDDRLPMCAGTFRWTCAAEDEADELSMIMQRVRRFEATLL